MAKEYDTRIIVLRRENMLKQAISAMNASRLKELSQREGAHASAHVTADKQAIIEELRATKMVVDFAKLKHMLSGLKKSYALLDKVASGFDDTLDITYEDYCNDRNATLGKMLKHIDVDYASSDVPDAYAKITSDDLSNVVKNYDGLVRFATGTPYEAML